MTTNVTPTIKCRVVTHYIEDQSEPDNQRYVFSYTITIANLGQSEAQLLSRRWLITDANGKKLVIEGEGVVGEQPVIAAHDEYTYTSGTIIETPLGVMQGHYVMADENGDEFLAEIAPFRLSVPNILH
ncbi:MULTISPECIES: Co2+/Mg2+ efflux protein ApaG [Photobacterium]|uniref:Protein ApaG n=1 Tax=Photobacterium ganghwense TaxID=320778 RepID=A0A0J1HHU8_9GAMM|nr:MULTISPECIES: Co2+/Mg2+ efflux protein ApaG [Photobacterium]KLV11181.1 magnesium transporter ApaG [Photobacterium ganghwense]MBV1839973.1 Co2+/Mg2+ efflux protein ApaG [Photobacterium ganghwense]PSU05193.1 Co2+/Mg2+ efflux protein ApaG [Photobacterium ganghwense]QSV13815.1 Co2+/Mg2+ efflux protein ApaG [Photobacterium ganghwense]